MFMTWMVEISTRGLGRRIADLERGIASCVADAIDDVRTGQPRIMGLVHTVKPVEGTIDVPAHQRCTQQADEHGKRREVAHSEGGRIPDGHVHDSERLTCIPPDRESAIAPEVYDERIGEPSRE
jgi:hypothetical protein